MNLYFGHVKITEQTIFEPQKDIPLFYIFTVKAEDMGVALHKVKTYFDQQLGEDFFFDIGIGFELVPSNANDYLELEVVSVD